MSLVRIAPAGDSAFVAEFPAGIDLATSRRVVALEHALRARCGSVLRELVVGFCSLTIYFDPLAIDGAWLADEIRQACLSAETWEDERRAVLDIPVCYDNELGLDLADVSASTGLSPEAIAELHSEATYRVFMVGFTPGFAYLAPVDPRLALPRRATPRTVVPAGSVAIAAGQTAIYPEESPGGWHIIGRTRVRPFDSSRPQPFLFRPGDRVRFVPIDRPTYDRPDK